MSLRTSFSLLLAMIMSLRTSFSLLLAMIFLHKGHCQIKAVPFDLMGSPPALTGAMQQNDDLSKAERYKSNQVKGAESFVYNNGHIYTGLSDGRIVDISDCGVRTIARLPCTKDKCARPRGLRLSPDGTLIAAVGGVGIVRIYTDTGRMEKLFAIETPVNGKQCKYLNDVIVARDGTIFFTDSSTRWTGDQYLYIVLEGESSGRLIALDPWSKNTFVVIDQMSYPNGLEFGPNEQYLLIAETSRARIRKLDLRINTPFWRRQTLFASNLPGLPDNIRASGKSTFWVAMGQSRNTAMTSSWVDSYAQQPDMREMIAMMASMEQILQIRERYGTIIELDGRGNIVRSLQDPTGNNVHAVTEVMERDGYLYLGSRTDNYVSRVPMSTAFNVDRFIAKLKSTCRATKITNLENLKRVLRRLVAIAEFRRALLEYKKRREEEERARSTTAAPLESTTTASPITTPQVTTPQATTPTTGGTAQTTAASQSTATASGQQSTSTSAAPTTQGASSSTSTGSPSTTTVSDDPDVPAISTTASSSTTTGASTSMASTSAGTGSTSSVTGSTASSVSTPSSVTLSTSTAGGTASTTASSGSTASTVSTTTPSSTSAASQSTSTASTATSQGSTQSTASTT